MHYQLFTPPTAAACVQRGAFVCSMPCLLAVLLKQADNNAYVDVQQHGHCASTSHPNVPARLHSVITLSHGMLLLLLLLLLLLQPDPPVSLSGTSASIASLTWQVAAKENQLEKVQDELQQVSRSSMWYICLYISCPFCTIEQGSSSVSSSTELAVVQKAAAQKQDELQQVSGVTGGSSMLLH
jgi:hypothetical protein